MDENKIPNPEEPTNAQEENKIPNPEESTNTQEENKKQEVPEVDEYQRRAQERLKREIEWDENYKKEKAEKERRRQERQKIYAKINLGLLALSVLGVSYLYYQGTLFDHLKRFDQKFSAAFFVNIIIFKLYFYFLNF